MVAKDDELTGDKALWTKVIEEPKTNYKSQYKRRISWQNCAAKTTVYEATNGKAPDEKMEERNLWYVYAMKNGIDFRVKSGWR